MTTMRLDRAALQQARAVIARESPTRTQELIFRLASWLIALTFFLLIGWVVSANVFFGVQQFVLLAAQWTLIAGVALFACSSPFAVRLFRAVAAARRLRVPWWSGAPRSWPSSWVLSLALMHFVGWGVLVLGAIGLIVEAEPGQRDDFPLALGTFLFGVSLVCLLPMEVIRLRIRTLVPIRNVLDSITADSNEIAAGLYDRITNLQFEQTAVDSYHSLRNAEQSSVPLAVKLTPGAHNAFGGMKPADACRVSSFIVAIGREPHRSAPPSGTFTVGVPDTAWKLQLRWHSDRKEMEVLAVVNGSDDE